MAVTVVNLSTSEHIYYTCTPRQAVVAAYAQSKRDWNTWQYFDRYDNLVVEGEATLSCGDYCVFKDGREF